jgi:ELWxxDGT repeat protein
MSRKKSFLPASLAKITWLVSAQLALLVSMQPALAFDPPTPLGPLNPNRRVTSETGLPGAVITSSNKLIFASDRDASIGVEVFVTDLATNTTTLLKDIVPGSVSSSPSSFQPLGPNKVVFAAQTASNGLELWTTDGTAAGTVLAADVNPGSSGSFPNQIQTTTAAGIHYAVFSAFKGGQGFEVAIYRESDGAIFFVDVSAGSEESYPSNLYVHPTTAVALFSAFTTATGREPYKINFSGPAPVLSLLADVNPGPNSSTPSSFFYFPAFDEAYFAANNGTSGVEPYVNNSSLGNINPGAASSNPACFASSGAIGYFIAQSGSAFNLYAFNGAFPAVIITTLPGYVNPSSCTVVNTGGGNRLIFNSYGPNGSELWVSNFTAGGTTELRDILPGFDSSDPTHLATVGTGANQRAIFAATDLSNGREMWSTDGTAAGTNIVVNANTGSQGSAPQLFATGANTAVFLSVTSNTSPYLSLFRSNGTTSGTALIGSFPDKDTTQSIGAPFYLGTAGEKLIYTSAGHPSYGAEPFASDGTAAGTGLLRDLNPGSRDSVYYNALSVNNKVIFSASGAGEAFDPEPWVTDGTPAGTVQLGDYWPGATGSQPKPLGVMNGFAYFIVQTPGTPKIFKTDGTPAGSEAFTLPAGFRLGLDGTVAGNQLFFLCDPNGTFNYELCKSDGTSAGTSLVKDIDGVPGTSSSPQFFASAGNRVVFMANDGVHGVELWGSDGSSAGTVLLGDLQPGAAGQSPFFSLSAEAAGKRFLTLSTPGEGLELWSTDGTAAGTVRLTDLEPGPINSQFLSGIEHDGKLFFSARGADGQIELYSSNGTRPGTGIFFDPEPLTSSNVSSMSSIAGHLFFNAYTTTVGPELFYVRGSDLSTLTTVFVNGSFNGVSDPNSLTSSRGKLYFQAFNSSSKYSELYQMVVDACPDDANKIATGSCGCGVADVDTDLDGSFDCNDSCPSDPAKTTAGVCGCGVADADKDGNGQLDCQDDVAITVAPGGLRVRVNAKKKEMIFTVPNTSGVRYLFTVSQLKSKNGRTVGSKTFESSTVVTKRKLSALRIRGKKLSGWVSVSYQHKIGTKISPTSNTVKLRIR